MNGLIIVVCIALALLAGLAALTRLIQTKPTGTPDFQVAARRWLFTKAENAFYRALVPVAQELGLAVFPKVGLNDVFQDKPGADKGQYNRYAQMHVDFLVVTADDFQRVAGIELDGASHQGARQHARDQKKAAVFKAARLPLVRFYNDDGTEGSTIRARLVELNIGTTGVVPSRNR